MQFYGAVLSPYRQVLGTGDRLKGLGLGGPIDSAALGCGWVRAPAYGLLLLRTMYVDFGGRRKASRGRVVGETWF